MNREKEIQNILDRNFTRGDNANALKELLDLFNQSLSKEEVETREIIWNFINWYNERHPENYIPNSRLGNYLIDLNQEEK